MLKLDAFLINGYILDVRYVDDSCIYNNELIFFVLHGNFIRENYFSVGKILEAV